MPQALAWVVRRRSSCIRSRLRATSIPPDSAKTPSALYCSVESRVSSNISREYSIGKMKLDACPVDPPGFGSGPLSTSTTSRQPSSARWWTRLLPTMPAPITTALARDATSAIGLIPSCWNLIGAVGHSPGKSGVMGHSPISRQELGQGGLQPAEAGVNPGEGEAEEVCYPGRRRLQFGGRFLGEPDEPPVVAEIVAPQLRVPVQPEAGQHRAVERPHQVVGEQVGARFLCQQLGDPVRAGENVVAVQPGQAFYLVECAVGAAVGVGHHGARA